MRKQIYCYIIVSHYIFATSDEGKVYKYALLFLKYCCKNDNKKKIQKKPINEIRNIYNHGLIKMIIEFELQNDAGASSSQ